MHGAQSPLFIPNIANECPHFMGKAERTNAKVQII